ncbi:MAG: VIT domain-containing protein [Kofleriaceae bacterium]
MARIAAVLAAVFVTAGPATADHLQAHLEQPLQEISHTVDVRIEDGVATYVVQRQFKNTGGTADEVRLEIALPDGAVATGLRIRAKRTWHSGELLARDVAAARYQELTGRGVYDPKDPALLFWMATGTLFLQVFPVMPRSVSTVEYTLTAPTKYEAGRYHITYPRAVPQDREDLALVDPVITVRSDKTIPAVTLPRAGDPDADAQAKLAIAPAAITLWNARLGGIVASPQHAFARLELDAAPQISALPKRAQVVFALDLSYSAAKTLPAQLAIVRAYLGHLPDAEVELVAYRRTAVRVFGRFVAATTIDHAIEAAMQRGAFASGNGSALDEGARVAAAALTGRVGPHRIVMTTDELVRGSLRDDAIAALAGLDPATVVHVVVPQVEGDLAIMPATTAPLAAIVDGHHGIYAQLTGLAAQLPRELPKVVLELVRPTRIDRLTATGGFKVADTLAEGEGLRLFEDRPAAAPTKLTINGFLWNDPVRLEVGRSAVFDRATAGYVFGEAMHHSLTDAEMTVVAKAARAVSPVTSYLAIEPGVRPSTIGLPGGGATGWGTIGSGRYGTVGGGSHTSGRQQPDLQSLIGTKACVAAHRPAAGWGVKLAVDTTLDEVVDVRILDGSGAFATCLVEAAWAVRLDARFDLPHESFVVDLF